MSGAKISPGLFLGDSVLSTRLFRLLRLKTIVYKAFVPYEGLGLHVDVESYTTS